jgi:hypothetical protein
VSESESKCRGHSSRVSVHFTVLRSRAICVQSVYWCGRHTQQTRAYALCTTPCSARNQSLAVCAFRKSKVESTALHGSSCAGFDGYIQEHSPTTASECADETSHTCAHADNGWPQPALSQDASYARPQQKSSNVALKLQLCDVRFCLNRPHVGAPQNANARATREQLHCDVPTKI